MLFENSMQGYIALQLKNFLLLISLKQGLNEDRILFMIFEAIHLIYSIFKP